MQSWIAVFYADRDFSFSAHTTVGGGKLGVKDCAGTFSSPVFFWKVC